MTGKINIENFIRQIVNPLYNEMGLDFIFMDDNGRPDRGRNVRRPTLLILCADEKFRKMVYKNLQKIGLDFWAGIKYGKNEIFS